MGVAMMATRNTERKNIGRIFVGGLCPAQEQDSGRRRFSLVRTGVGSVHRSASAVQDWNDGCQAERREFSIRRKKAPDA